MGSPPQVRRRLGFYRVAGAAFFSLGLALAVFCGYMLWGTNVAGDRASAQILELAAEDLDQTEDSGAAAPAASGRQLPAAGSVTGGENAAKETSAQRGDLLGVISIPSVDLEVPVLEGTEADVLDQGVLGHYPGTGSPGGLGNFAVAGHRTTHGAPLYDIEEIAVGDAIVVRTGRGWDVYTMQRQRVVDPEAVEVLAPVPDDPGATATARWMVLTSCHPKLSAAERIVAYARWDRHVPRSEGAPAELG